ncbi:MAG: hypothetical protein ABSB41_08610 [Anaerolineales bacterium]|jgi:hypothetical protein
MGIIILDIRVDRHLLEAHTSQASLDEFDLQDGPDLQAAWDTGVFRQAVRRDLDDLEFHSPPESNSRC